MNFTKINNNILNTLCKQPIPPKPRQIFDTILRYTFGFNRISNQFKLDFFVKKTNLDKIQVCKAIKYLSDNNYITKTKSGRFSDYCINDPEHWKKPVCKNYQKQKFSKPNVNIYINKKIKNKTTKKGSFFLDNDKEQIITKYVEVKIQTGHDIKDPTAYKIPIRQALKTDNIKITELEHVITRFESEQRQKSEKKARNEELKKVFCIKKVEKPVNDDSIIKIKAAGIYENEYKIAEDQLKKEINNPYFFKIPAAIINERIIKNRRE